MKNYMRKLNNVFSVFERQFLKINKVPFIRNIGFVKRLICKIYRIPNSTQFHPNFFCNLPILNLGQNVSLNDTRIYGWSNLTGGGDCTVTIGNNTGFSYGNVIITSTHDFSKFGDVIGKPVVIGNNVWITSNVTILPGVKIGDNTVIGAGSVVTKDIPSRVLAAGNPCRVIKMIEFHT